MILQDYKERFENSFIPVTETGCWLWEKSHNYVYGTVSIKNHTYLAHRISYRMYKEEIPEGMLVCHRCDVPMCVNPDHLFLGTLSDNRQDAVRKGRIRKKICKNGHEMTPENTYHRKDRIGHRMCKKCNNENQKRTQARAKQRRHH